MEFPAKIENEKTIVEPLDKVVQHLEEEARMVLPGIQALFGFQLIAVFNQRFTDLSEPTQILHLIALLCTASSVLFVLTPAAYHRQAEPGKISPRFCRLGTRLLTLSLFPLALGISLDLYVISRLILDSILVDMAIASISFVLLLTAWFLFPQWAKVKNK